eukprot:55019-Eustigmatos_ZCMA.PRE.1
MHSLRLGMPPLVATCSDRSVCGCLDAAHWRSMEVTTIFGLGSPVARCRNAKDRPVGAAYSRSKRLARFSHFVALPSSQPRRRKE